MSGLKTTTALVSALATGAVLVGCTENRPASVDGTVSVTSTATTCTVSASSVKSGNTTFTIKNEGPKVTEFYLLAEDKLRIVSERENIAPGQSVNYTVSLQPGTYYTACKPGMRGANVGVAQFSVSGDPIQLSGEDKQLFDKVVADYVNFVKNEVAELQPAANKLVKAYIAGDDELARKLFASTRVHYERIEPVAEALGGLDPRIDYREINYLAEAAQLKKDDPTFTQWLGFHRMEKDLWQPKPGQLQPDGTSAHAGWKASDPATRKIIGETLLKDIEALYQAVHAPDFVKTSRLNIAGVSNGASGLLEEIAVTKVTGEEDWWSHTDLYDFQGNLEGAKIAFDLVAPIAERKSEEGKQIVAKVRKAFDALQAELSKYGSLEKGFVSYDTVDDAKRKELTAKLDAVREPLSKLTNAVLGIK